MNRHTLIDNILNISEKKRVLSHLSMLDLDQQLSWVGRLTGSLMKRERGSLEMSSSLACIWPLRAQIVSVGAYLQSRHLPEAPRSQVKDS
jgi:hypothetical protein